MFHHFDQFAGLICIAKDLHAGRMFSGTLARCVLLLGVIYTAASVWIPRLSGYHSSGYEILSSDAFVLIDGTILLPGLLLLVLGSLIREGARMLKRTGGNIVGGAVMAIILRLDRVMADRKMSLNELSDRVGISNVNLSNLKTGKVKAVRFSTLDAICDVLDCQPGDILEYKRETEEKTKEKT